MSKNYIDNEAFYKELCEWIEHFNKTRREQIKKGKIEPIPITNSIGKKIIQIAERYANKWNFNGYTFKSKMIGEGVLTATKYAHNFKPIRANGEKGNALAYFTRILWSSFLKVIAQEKRQYSVHKKLIERMHYEQSMVERKHDTEYMFSCDYNPEQYIDSPMTVYLNGEKRVFKNALEYAAFTETKKYENQSKSAKKKVIKHTDDKRDKNPDVEPVLTVRDVIKLF